MRTSHTTLRCSRPRIGATAAIVAEPDLAAEWNLHAQPAAAQAVLDSGVPIALVPLHATDDVP